MYKKLLGLIAILLAAVTVFSAQASAADTTNFVIKSFVADYYLSRDSKNHPHMQINETIVAEFPEFDQNHGFLRAIPATYKGTNLNLKINSVKDEQGNPIQYKTKKQNDNLVLKIGNPDTYVSGLKTYKIDYSLSNPITFYPNHDELYWDVNGDQWPQVFNEVQANIHIPKDIAANLKTNKKCFTGSFGSTATNCTIKTLSDANSQIVTVSAKNLQPNETLTYLLGFSQGTFKKDFFASSAFQKIRYAIIVFSLPLVVTLFMLIQWLRYGRDAKGRTTIIPQYQRPTNFSIAECAFIYKEKLPKNALSATIIDLAIKRYINIVETSKNSYKLVLIKNPNDLASDEQKIIKMHFNSTDVNTEVYLSSLKYKMASQYSDFSNEISKRMQQNGYFKKDVSGKLAKYSVIGSFVVGAGILVPFFVYDFIGIITGILIGTSIGISGIVILIFNKIMPARTIQGAEVNDYLLGLKQYMTVAEKDRIAYMQSPEGAKQFNDPTKAENPVHLYEKLLPFAIIMGVEMQWSNQFKDLYINQQPDWYQGDTANFSNAYMISSLSNFNSVTASNFQSPSSSDGSGFSGGGDGGFSGGGGGGGGGDGW